jgi:electron transfer flavoprotein alpha subunit
MPKNTKGIEVAEIIQDRCIGCQICVGECPVGAIELTPDGVAVIDPEVCVGCGKCEEVCPVEAVRFEKKRRKKKAKVPRPAAAEALAEYEGVGVYIEILEGAGAEVSWELLGKASELAGKLANTKVLGLLVGHEVKGVAEEAIAFGCDEVHIIDDPLLKRYLSKTYGQALTHLCAAVKPDMLLLGATPLGRDLSGIVATLLETGLTADCTGLDIEEETGLLLMTRPTFGGNIMATIFCENHRPQMSTVRPKVFPLPSKDSTRRGRIVEHPWQPPAGELPEIIDFIADVREIGSVDIAGAPALVVAGKGACDPDTMPMLQELADLLNAVVACSRPVVEAGLMPYERQVGQTGKTVAPRLYVGVGVSGAVQHLVGMQGSEKIIAINSDPHAPIFEVADVGLVGDYVKVVPALIAGLKNRLDKGGYMQSGGN